MLWLPGGWLPDADLDMKGLEMCSQDRARGPSAPRGQTKEAASAQSHSPCYNLGGRNAVNKIHPPAPGGYKEVCQSLPGRREKV